MLELINICKNYKVGDRVTEALKNINISFGESEFVSVLGPSGCGKTTLLNIIGGLDAYTSGDLLIRGVSTKKYRGRDWDTYRNHSVGFVFQSYNLIPHQTVFANVELALTLAGVSRAERKRRVLEALDKVGLSDQIHKKPNQMSGGQMQRVAIARAIVNDPEILLADEPTGALDSKTSVQIMEILKEISKERLIIMVTHNPELAETYSTRIVRLKDGEVISDSDAVQTVPDAPIKEGENSEDISSFDAEHETLANAGEAQPQIPESEIKAEEDSAYPLGGSDYYEKEAILKFRKLRSGADRETVSDPEEAKDTPDDTGEVLQSEASGEAEAAFENTPDAAPEANEEVKEAAPQETIGDEPEKAETVAKEEENAAKNTAGTKASKGRKKKTSMSFFTALSLSFKNLLTKKGRTFITAFAGSIGIIGIALILAISTGVQNYIDDVQRDTLSSYPITIEEEHKDLSSILGIARQKQEERAREEKAENTAYSNSRAYDMFNAFFADSAKTNNLKDFKAWLDGEIASEDSESKIGEYITTVHYGYGVKINTYVKDSETGNYLGTAFMDILTGTGAGEGLGFMSSALSSSSFSYDLWDELIPGKDGAPISDLIKDQYDLIYGSWPESKEDVLLLVDANNEMPDMAFYTLGIMSREDLSLAVMSAMSGKEVEFKEHSVKFEDLDKIDLKLVLSADLYTDPDGDGIFTDASSDNGLLQLIVSNSLSLHICGVIRANPDATATSITANATFCYTNLLTEYIIEKTGEAASVKRLLESEDENVDVFNGLPYFIDISGITDQDRIDGFRNLTETLSNAEKAEALKKIISTPDEEYINKTIETFLSADTREQMEELIAKTYGASADAIRQYLEAYSDEELAKMIRETAEKTIREKYAAEAEEKINEIVETPSEFELLALKMYISGQFETDQAKKGFVAMYWDSLGVMTVQEAYVYLASLPGDSFEALFDRTVEQAAVKMYAENAAQDPDRVNTKLAAAFDEYVANADDETAVKGYNIVVINKVSENSFQDNKKMLGILDLASPQTISIYPETFENKEKIAAIITDYNDSKEAEEDRIYYTDYVAVLMSGITTIINAISYVLIAFVAVSLVVSSIMIGIITYVSVLERTKEIGILRSIGASKKDIARVFTAETLIIGFASGLIGIGASFLFCFPINAIVHFFTKIDTINAVIPIYAAGILVAISMLLTFLAGLIPSIIASRKNPVEALRTE